MFTVDTGVQLGKIVTQVDTGVGAGVFVVRVTFTGVIESGVSRETIEACTLVCDGFDQLVESLRRVG